MRFNRLLPSRTSIALARWVFKVNSPEGIDESADVGLFEPTDVDIICAFVAAGLAKDFDDVEFIRPVQGIRMWQ